MSISVYVISAICGNFYQESTVNPGIFENLNVVPLTDNSVYGGYGLGQWTNKASAGLTRRTQLVNWLTSHGYSSDDGDGQLAFLIAENYWHNNYGPYNSLAEFLGSTSTDISELTKIFMRCWEGVSSNLITRQTWANTFFNYINSHYYDSNINIWHTGNRYLSNQERKENAVLVARYLIDGTPTPTPPPTPPPRPPRPFSSAEYIITLLLNRKRRRR